MAVKGNIQTCPNCNFEMRKVFAPFKFHGSYVGKFEAYKCEQCHRVYFTKRTCREIMTIPLNPDEASNFSDENKLPTEKAFSPVIIANKKKTVSTVNIGSVPLESYLVALERPNDRNWTDEHDSELQTVS